MREIIEIEISGLCLVVVMMNIVKLHITDKRDDTYKKADNLSFNK